jgi:diguanylate cyclase (GGDEF)-like protein
MGIQSKPETASQEADFLRRQMDELSVLNAVATAGAQASDIETLIEKFVRAISERIYPEILFGIGVVDEKANAFHGYIMDRGKLEKRLLPLEKGISGRVIASGQPIRLDNVDKEPDYFPLFSSIRSELCVPLKTAERTIGVLNAESTRLNVFTEADEQLMMTFAGQLALAIERVRLYQQAVQTAEIRAVLYRAAQEISASLDLEQVYQAIHTAVSQLMPCEDLLIALLDDSRDEIQAVYMIENGQRLAPGHFPAWQGLSGRVIATGKALKVDDFACDYTDVPVVIFGEDRSHSALVVPLMVKGRAFGALSAQSHTLNAYSVDDQEMLELLAAQAAIAIENARLFAKVQQLATHDSLTSIYNRHHFFMLAKTEVERARRYNFPLSLIIIDIDHFKRVNDTYGHAMGDQVLQSVVRSCCSQLREADLMGRYGGEEFVILLPHTAIDEAQKVAERLRHEIETAKTETGKGPLTISLGVAVWDETCKNAEALIERADQALYRAKNAGRNRVGV